MKYWLVAEYKCKAFCLFAFSFPSQFLSRVICFCHPPEFPLWVEDTGSVLPHVPFLGALSCESAQNCSAQEHPSPGVCADHQGGIRNPWCHFFCPKRALRTRNILQHPSDTPFQCIFCCYKQPEPAAWLLGGLQPESFLVPNVLEKCYCKADFHHLPSRFLGSALQITPCQDLGNMTVPCSIRAQISVGLECLLHIFQNFSLMGAVVLWESQMGASLVLGVVWYSPFPARY